MGKKLLALIMILAWSVCLVPAVEAAPTVTINGRVMSFDVSPVIENGRTLVPLRDIFEALGAVVDWDGAARTVIAQKNNTTVRLTIGSNIAYRNNDRLTLEVPPRLVQDRTLVPVRFVAESLGATVAWDEDNYTVEINSQSELAVNGIAIGDPVSRALDKLGEPARQDLSKYGFNWYIYNQDYANYLQVGVQNGQVVGLYSNSGNWQMLEGIGPGASRQDVREKFGQPLSEIRKGTTIYAVEDAENRDTYLFADSYVSFMYDQIENGTLDSVLIINARVEQALSGYYGQPSGEMRTAFANESFDLANAARMRRGLTPFKWDDGLAQVAYQHSLDMAEREFFSHINPDGRNPFDRMEAAGIRYRLAAENIAAGASDAIAAHQGWMNSPGHRSNILGESQNLGIGVAFGGSYHVYYTQNFRTPR